jgi:hypothetical protein
LIKNKEGDISRYEGKEILELKTKWVKQQQE